MRIFVWCTWMRPPPEQTNPRPPQPTFFEKKSFVDRSTSQKKETWMGTRCFSDHGTVFLRGIGKQTVEASECENDRNISQKRDLDGHSMF